MLATAGRSQPFIFVHSKNAYESHTSVNKKAPKGVPAIEQYAFTNREMTDNFKIICHFFLTSTAFVDTKAKPRARRGRKSYLSVLIQNSSVLGIFKKLGASTAFSVTTVVKIVFEKIFAYRFVVTVKGTIQCFIFDSYIFNSFRHT